LRVAPRAGFEPATNRLTVVFSRYRVQYVASTCTVQAIVNRQHLAANRFRVIAGYCA
jgi:hypothetical protein